MRRRPGRVFANDQASQLVLLDPSHGTSTLVPRPAGIEPAVLPTLSGTPGSIWLAGGIIAGPHLHVPLDTLFKYDLTQGVWFTRTMSQARAATGVAHTSAKLMVAGSIVGSVSLVPTDTVDVFDLAGSSHSTATLSSARVWPSSIQVGGQLIFAGGLERAVSGLLVASADVDIYDDRVGTIYCSPAVVNSTGMPAHLRVEGAPGTVAQGHVTLVATALPAAGTGYFLASRSQGLVPGAGGSQGTLCLGGPIGRDVELPGLVPRCEPRPHDQLHIGDRDHVPVTCRIGTLGLAISQAR